VVDGPRGQRQTALVDKRAGALGVLFGFRHTNPTAAGCTPVTSAPHHCGRRRPVTGGW
jgi:hypothetical protein